MPVRSGALKGVRSPAWTSNIPGCPGNACATPAREQEDGVRYEPHGDVSLPSPSASWMQPHRENQRERSAPCGTFPTQWVPQCTGQGSFSVTEGLEGVFQVFLELYRKNKSDNSIRNVVKGLLLQKDQEPKRALRDLDSWRMGT